jgi:hypothetical protein
MKEIGIAIIFEDGKDAEKFGQSLIDWADNEIKILAEGKEVPWTVWRIGRNNDGTLKLFIDLLESKDEEDTIEINPDEVDTVEIDPSELEEVD